MPTRDPWEIAQTPVYEPRWLVEQMFYEGQMVCLAGAPGVGKSFLAYTLAFCVATGQPFLGRQVCQGSVLYFDEENSYPDLAQYLRLIWRGLGEPSPVATFTIEHFSLSLKTQRFAYMRERAKQIQPTLIVIDTATPVCGIQDENDNSEANIAIERLRAVKDSVATGATLLILKHERFSHETSATRTIRGAKVWLGALDQVLYHIRPQGRPRDDGLQNTRLEPDKVRAWGLRTPLTIIPSRTPNGGIILAPK